MRVFIFLQSSNITKNRGGIAMFDFVRKMTLAGAGLAIIRKHARPMNPRNEDFRKSPSVS
jgi:hypothetical protein